MIKMRTIWTLYVVILLVVFFCSSCAGAKPKYVAKKDPVRAEARKGKMTNSATVGLWVLFMTGVAFHIANEDSN